MAMGTILLAALVVAQAQPDAAAPPQGESPRDPEVQPDTTTPPEAGAQPEAGPGATELPQPEPSDGAPGPIHPDLEEERALEEDMRRSRQRTGGAPAPAPELEPGSEQRETGDWADEERWQRYRDGGEGDPGEQERWRRAREAEKQRWERYRGRETGDWAEDERWQRYRDRETGDWADEERWQRYRDGDGRPVRDPADGRWSGALWPSPLRHRSPGGAMALGFLVGFGSGYYYASEPRMGMMYSILDSVLMGGLVISQVAFVNLVVKNDFKKGRSLAGGDRDFGRREGELYVVTWMFAIGEVASRAIQGAGAFRAARRTNTVLQNVSLVPYGPGAGIRFGW